MSESGVAADLSSSELPVELRELGVYASDHDATQRGLVVLALGEAYWLVPDERGHRLLVEPHVYLRAREQLDRFEREQGRWPPRSADMAESNRRINYPSGWALALLGTYWAQGFWPEVTPLGALEGKAVIFGGEWWRPATALFLHADADHLLANGLAGFFLFGAVLTLFGRARGWLLLALASFGTNALLAYLARDSDYRSIGASTAVFAALGLLTGRAARLAAARQTDRWRPMFVPVAAGLAMVGLYGAGGPEVDIAAHVLGFVVGTVFCVFTPRKRTMGTRYSI